MASAKRTSGLYIYFGEDGAEYINRTRLCFHLCSYSSLTIME